MLFLYISTFLGDNHFIPNFTPKIKKKTKFISKICYLIMEVLCLIQFQENMYKSLMLSLSVPGWNKQVVLMTIRSVSQGSYGPMLSASFSIF